MSLKEAYDRAKDVLLDSHAALLNVSTDLHNLAERSTRQIHNLHSTIAATRDTMALQEKYILSKQKMSEVYENLLVIFSTQTLLNTKLSHLFLSCKANHIPATVIDQETFKKDLERVKIAADQNGMELAIQIKDTNLYYHTKLVTCTTSQNNMEIEI